MKKILTDRDRYLGKLKRTTVIVRIIQFGLLISFIVLWEVLARFNVIDSFITSSPSKIYNTFISLCKGGELLTHLFTTLYETVLSFIIATLLGTLIAILLWFSQTAQRIFEPYLVVLNSLPKIALGPIIIIWVGAGRSAIITMALLICLIITIINTLQGFVSVEKEKLLLMNSLGANKLQILLKLILPANIPTMISCLKINVGLTWVGTIMGEYLVSKAGLGYLIVYGGQVFNLSLVMCSTVILCILAGGMYLFVAALEKIIKKHYNFEI